MPYIITQLKLSNIFGTPLIRPMVFEYPDDMGVSLDSQWRQFMFGEAILVAPVLEEKARVMDVYFPRFYEVVSICKRFRVNLPVQFIQHGNENVSKLFQLKPLVH